MTVKLFYLNTKEAVIADAKEVKKDDSLVGYLLKFPQTVNILQEFIVDSGNEESSEDDNKQQEIKISMKPWIPFSKDDEVFVYPLSVVSIVDPVETVSNLYMEKVNG